MLVLSRKTDQTIKIGDQITLTVVRLDSGRVRIGIDAPDEMKILRGEVLAKALDTAHAEAVNEAWQPGEREMPFAHPQVSLAEQRRKRERERERESGAFASPVLSASAAPLASRTQQSETLSSDVKGTSVTQGVPHASITGRSSAGIPAAVLAQRSGPDAASSATPVSAVRDVHRSQKESQAVRPSAFVSAT
ncbi:Carbon storage regulator [Stieleria bergensis]|uniref:Translational regulator CsrA n=1 Tax=Stieleria bergensis TaxID=2528025 RepID=A0A517SS65_9BACT|nr:Carbon storage regulator [Planctomycetes bacterium SV_7m_r]